MAAGMNGQRFAFHGYLPVKPDARERALTALERDSRAQDMTQLFIETPYRNAAMIATLARVL
jgi:16S rRNA (cytidine1402-2'-O)-methyltransferase